MSNLNVNSSCFLLCVLENLKSACGSHISRYCYLDRCMIDIPGKGPEEFTGVVLNSSSHSFGIEMGTCVTSP